MTRKRDIFDFFRNNQRRLDETPPAHTWRRLERRLDAHRNRNRLSRYRLLGMAAGILVIVVLVGLISLSLGRQQSLLPAANRQAAPAAVEDLPLTDADPEGLRSVVAVKHAQELLQYPISEGAPGQKLILANQSPSSRNRGATLDAFHWMAGRWQSRENGQPSVEEWRLVGNGEMAGQASLDNEEPAREHLRLYTQDNKIFFSTDFGGKTVVQYGLVALNGQEALFENLQAGFPQQLRILREGQSRMAVIYQNAESQLPDTERMRNLRKRHTLISMQAVRRMSKVSLQ